MSEKWGRVPVPVPVHDDEAVVAPLDDEVGVQRDAEVFVVHLKNWEKTCLYI